MKGFRDSTKMMHGHNFARGGHSLQPRFGQMKPAPGPTSQPQGQINGLTGHGVSGEGHSAVMRSPVASTQELEEHGGKTPLTSGYGKGGKAAKHFHVHKHVYGKGGKVKTVSKSYMKRMEMQAEQGGDTNSNGGFKSGSTGGSRGKLATGGHIHDDTHEIAPDFAKGGKMHINPAHKGKFTKKMTGSKKGHLTGSDVQRGLHSESGETRKEANFARMARRHFKPLATGGTINRLGAGGALYAQGGGVSKSEAQGIARGVIKEHINYPEPRGHKGLGEAIKRGG